MSKFFVFFFLSHLNEISVEYSRINTSYFKKLTTPVYEFRINCYFPECYSLAASDTSTGDKSTSCDTRQAERIGAVGTTVLL